MTTCKHNKIAVTPEDPRPRAPHPGRTDFPPPLQGLAKSIAWDGEGATCLMEVSCTGAPDETAANALARSIAGSSLVKAAVYGHDPNWGRIACAAGCGSVVSSVPGTTFRLHLSPTKVDSKQRPRLGGVSRPQLGPHRLRRRVRLCCVKRPRHHLPSTSVAY